ncbi:MAG: tRNA (adenosine(37)-N6)-threonylcarbamoyltransferase complex ATPase subunit type 1 TsaE [Desulfobacterales bacterium]
METLSRVEICRSAAETRRLARCIAEAVREPLIILLDGELGSGKTCFAQGLAWGLGVPGDIPITSPTYTLVNDYPGSGRLPFVHADLYRLEAADLEDIGIDELLDRRALVAVEWPDRMGSLGDLERLEVLLVALEDETRRIEITAYGLGPVNLLKGCDSCWKEAS